MGALPHDALASFHRMHLVLRHYEPISDAEADARAATARELAAVATRAPKDGAWGLAFRHDEAAVLGGDAGGLLWFATGDELADLVERWLVYIPPRPMEEDLARAAAVCAAIGRRMRSGAATDDETACALSRDMARFLRCEWIGTFEALCTGRDDFALRARAGFRGHLKAAARTKAGESDAWVYAYDVSREDGEPPISPEELGVFRAGLVRYPRFVVDELLF